MSTDNSNVEFAPVTPINNEVYVKTNPLTPEQVEKGYYISIADNGSVRGFYQGTRISGGKYPGKTEIMLGTLDGAKVQIIVAAGNLQHRLNEALEKKTLEVGQPVEIRYAGKQAAKTGKYAGTMMHNFSLVPGKLVTK